MACVCSVCNQNFFELDVQTKCDSCNFQIHSKCSELTFSEQKILNFEKSYFKIFLSIVWKRFTWYSKLKQWITRLLNEVNDLKNKGNACLKNLKKFIINKLNERNLRALNLIMYFRKPLPIELDMMNKPLKISSVSLLVTPLSSKLNWYVCENTF